MRLLSSVFYDYGKSLRTACPYKPDLKEKQTMEFLQSNIKAYLQTFPNLKDISVACIPHVNHKITIEAFVKKSAKSGFGKG